MVLSGFFCGYHFLDKYFNLLVSKLRFLSTNTKIFNQHLFQLIFFLILSLLRNSIGCNCRFFCRCYFSFALLYDIFVTVLWSVYYYSIFINSITLLGNSLEKSSTMIWFRVTVKYFRTKFLNGQQVPSFKFM